MSDVKNAALIARLRKIAIRAGETMESLTDHGELEQADNTWAVDEFHQAYELHEVVTLAADALEAADQKLVYYEYGWEADLAIRATLSPRGPRIQMDNEWGTPEEISEFPRGKRIRRRKAGPWEEVK